MTQEKQKVIRVLKPVQKKKNVSPIYYGIAGVTFGIAVSSVLIFSFLDNKSDTNQIVTEVATTSVSEEKTVNATPVAPISTNSAPLEVADHQELDSEITHDDFNQPQPGLNDIGNTFKHPNEIKPEQTARHNPFIKPNEQKQAPKPALPLPAPDKAKPNPQATAKVQTAKAAPVKATDKKVDEKELAKAADKLKIKNVDKEPDVELPKATVQISVTRSAVQE